MADISQLIVKVKQKQTIQQLDKIQNKLGEVGKTAEDIGKAFLAGWSFTKVIQSIGSFSRMLIDVKVQARNFGAIFANSLSVANTQVTNLIQNFDQTQRSAQKLLSSIGSRIIQAGFSDIDSASIAGKFAVISQQIAASTGKNLQQISKKLSISLAGQTGGLKNIGIVINTNTQLFKKQVQELTLTNGLTEEQAKKQAILNEVLKQSQKYAGSFKQSADTIQRAFGNIANTFKSGIGAQIGKILNTFITPILNIVNKILENKVAKTIISWASAISLILIPFKLLSTLVKSIFSKTTSWISALAKSAIHANNVEETISKINRHFIYGARYAKSWSKAWKEAARWERKDALFKTLKEKSQNGGFTNDAMKAKLNAWDQHYYASEQFKLSDLTTIERLITASVNRFIVSMITEGNAFQKSLGLLMLKLQKYTLGKDLLNPIITAFSKLAGTIYDMFIKFVYRPVKLALRAAAIYMGVGISTTFGLIFAGALMIFYSASDKFKNAWDKFWSNIIYNALYKADAQKGQQQVKALEQRRQKLKQLRDSINQQQKKFMQLRKQNFIRSTKDFYKDAVNVQKKQQDLIKVGNSKQVAFQQLAQTQQYKKSPDVALRQKYHDALKKYNQLTIKENQIQDDINKSQENIYNKRKQWFEKIKSLRDWYSSNVQTILDWGDNKKLSRNFKMSDLVRQVFDLQSYRKQLKGEDLANNYKKEAQLRVQYDGLVIEGLKQQLNVAKEFRNFIIETAKSIMQFKSTGTNAITTSSTQGYKFSTSKEGQFVLPQHILSNQKSINDINSNILNYQIKSFETLNKMYNSVSNISKAIGGAATIGVVSINRGR